MKFGTYSKLGVSLLILSVGAITGCGRRDTGAVPPAPAPGGLATGTGPGYGYGGVGGCLPIGAPISFVATSPFFEISKVTSNNAQLGGGAPGPYNSRQGQMGHLSANINRTDLGVPPGGYQGVPGVSALLTLSNSTIANLRAMALQYAFSGGGFGYGNGYGNGYGYGYGNGYGNGYGYGGAMPEPCVSNVAFELFTGAAYVYGTIVLTISVPNYNGQLQQAGQYPIYVN